MVNSTQHTIMILDQIKALTSTIKSLESRVNNKIVRGDRGFNVGGISGGVKYCRHRDSGKYCWSHDNAGLEGPTCITKSNSYKDKATFQNKIGGSIRGYDPDT